jgi:hypothetical protein
MVKTKRKVPASASKAVSLEQASVTCVPAKRMRNQALSALESAKLNAALSNDVSHGWERASNLRMQQQEGKCCYAVVRLRAKKESAKACRTFSKACASVQAAEEVAFDFCGNSIESESAKQKVKEWLDRTASLLESRSGTTDTAPPVVMVDPVPQKMKNKCMSTDRRKSLSMASSLFLRSVHDPPNKNPRNPLSNSAFFEVRASLHANKIQKAVRRRDRKRAEMALMKTLTEQEHRMTLMIAVATILSNSDWKSLLLGGHDPDFDQDHALNKARHIHKVLRTMRSAHLQKTVVTWGECCESAALANFNKHARHTAMAWCTELHKTKNQIKFRRSL